LAKMLLESCSAYLSFRCEEDSGILLHQRRRLDDGQLLLMVNTSIDRPVSGTLTCAFAGIERWEPATGKTSAYPFAKTDHGLKAAFELPPCGSLLLFLADTERKPAAASPKKVATIRPSAPPRVRRLGPNVLTLDYVDITTGGRTEKNLYFYRANQMAWQAAGMERNPWDSSVQFRDQLITRRFPPDSGFEATYRFTIEGHVPKGLEIVIERPDLYTITCNGKPVQAKQGAWWLDKAFGRIDITGAAKTGENGVTIKARPMTIYHELEPAYVLGDFNLKASTSGFVIIPPQPLNVTDAGWNQQGHPFYAAGVSYTETFDVPKPSGSYRVRAPKWYGSVARVRVNGKPAGHLAWQPWECDVTKLIRPGANTVEVTVIGTLKNTLGPHHAGTLRGAAWPTMFQRGPETGPPPGASYDTISYGLFEPFELRHAE
jgi:hypothetical protein